MKKLYHMPGLDDEQFKEFNNLMRVNHQNIVRLVGYCYEIRYKHFEHNGGFSFAEMAERALCFEYFEAGSLDKHLSGMSIYTPMNHVDLTGIHVMKLLKEFVKV